MTAAAAIFMLDAILDNSEIMTFYHFEGLCGILLCCRICVEVLTKKWSRHVGLLNNWYSYYVFLCEHKNMHSLMEECSFSR